MDNKEKLVGLQSKPFETLNVFEPGRKEPIRALINNVELSAEAYPETFQIPSLFIRKKIPVGMMVKVIVDWNKKFFFPERFWVEVTNITTDRDGELCYFGVARNDTFVARYDTPIGPLYARHICDFDMDAYIEKHKELLAA